MSPLLEARIREVKLEKAERSFRAALAAYGSLSACLRSLDCRTREEALRMLAAVQEVHIYKVDGVIRVD